MSASVTGQSCASGLFPGSVSQGGWIIFLGTRSRSVEGAASTPNAVGNAIIVGDANGVGSGNGGGNATDAAGSRRDATDAAASHGMEAAMLLASTVVPLAPG